MNVTLMHLRSSVLMLALLLASLATHAQTVQSLTFASSTLPAGTYTSATVTLSAAPTSGSFIVLVSASDPSLAFPTRVDVPQGQTSVTFRVATNPVTTNTTAQLTAAGQPVNSGSANASLTVTPRPTRSVPVSADAFVRWGDPANNGTSTQLLVKNGLDTIRRITYLKFDLTGLTDLPDTAVLRLTQPYQNNNGPITVGCYSISETNWTESGINGVSAANPNGAPGLRLDTPTNSVVSTGTLQESQPVWFQALTSGNGSVTFDVTSFIRANLGQVVTLQLVGITLSDQALTLNSKEAGANLGPSLLLSYASPWLNAQPVSSSQVTLTWDDPGTGRESYLIERKDTPTSPWIVIARVGGDLDGFDDVNIIGSSTYVYRLRGQADTTYTAYSNESTVQSLLGGKIDGWSYLAAYPTSTSSVRLYWQPVPNITSYQVFRSTTRSQYNFTQPIATLSGTATFYDDSGLTNGQPYFYVVRATSTSGVSADTYEDSATPQSGTIPWNGTASQIVQSAYQIAASELNGGQNFDIGNLRVMAPDGSIYLFGSSSPLPQNGSVDITNGIMTLGEVSMLVPGEVLAARAPGGDANAGGGLRRVVAREASTTNQKIDGVGGIFYLPDGLDCISVPPLVNNTPRVAGNLYIGLNDASPNGTNVDAGVQFNQARLINGVSYPNRWQPVLRIADGRGTKTAPGSGYGTPINERLMGLQLSNKLIPSDTSGAGAGKFIFLSCTVDNVKSRVSFGVFASDVYGLYYYDYYVAAAKNNEPTRVYPGNKVRKFVRPQMKRVISCDQLPAYYGPSGNKWLFYQPPSDAQKGAIKDSSYLKNVFWQSGQLRVGGVWQTWTPALIATNPRRNLMNPFDFYSQYNSVRTRSNDTPMNSPIQARKTVNNRTGFNPDEELIDIIH